MTFEDFLIKWNGRFIDFDGAYGPQCMDLMHQYIVEVLGLTDGRILAAPAAKDVFNNFDTIVGREYFEKIANTPTGVPQEGDIVLWETGTWGHVAIFIEGDVNKFNSFDQNYPVGSPCHIQSHTYSGCLGWLRFKGGEQNQQKIIDQLRKERDDNWNLYQETKTQLDGAKTEIDSLREQLSRKNENHESQLKQFASILGSSPDTAELSGKMMELVGIEDRLREAQKKIDQLTKEALEDQKTIDELEKRMQDTTEEIKSHLRALGELEEAKKQMGKDLEKCQKQLPTNKKSFWEWLKSLFHL